MSTDLKMMLSLGSGAVVGMALYHRQYAMAAAVGFGYFLARRLWRRN